MTLSKKEWFTNWFESPFYDLLYQHRNEEEARLFMDALTRHLQVKPHHRILDLACGKGRHSIYLNKLGFDVTGVDLSTRKIALARESANERLHFFIHDMREVYKPSTFDFIFNLFTSFGYFGTDEEHVKTIRSAAAGLQPNGILVLDYFNTYRVLERLPETATILNDGITFHTHKHLRNGFVVKDIRFEHEGEAYSFQENVRALTEADFIRYFEAAGLQIIATWGDYQLGTFSPKHSDRMIFVGQKRL